MQPIYTRLGKSEVQRGLDKAIWHIDDIEFAFGEATAERVGAVSTLLVDSTMTSRGGLGETRRVRTAAGDVLACKVMLMPNRALFTSDDTYEVEVAHRTRAFREEYDSLCRFSSFKGFVKAHAYGRLGTVPIILMEWVEGVSLSNVLAQRGSLPAFSAAQIGRDLFHLLARLEWQADLFVHRDISPANVMIRTHETSFNDQLARGYFDICLIDFGSATTLWEGDGAFTMDTHILRGATPAYAAPEMLSIDLPRLGELRRSPKIDVYAACSVLYALLCGHAPFNLRTADQASSDYVLKMTHDPLPAGFAPDTPEDLLANIACSGIKPSQDERPSSYALFKALEHYCVHYGENAARFDAGQDPVVLDMFAIDHPRQGVDQVALSNPLSHKPTAEVGNPSWGKQPSSEGEAGKKPFRGMLKVAMAVFIVVLIAGAVFFSKKCAPEASRDSHAPDNTASSSSSSPGTALSNKAETVSPLAGTWMGKLVSTSEAPACYGGRQDPMILTVMQVEDDALTCDLTAVYHGHNRQTQMADAASNAGDSVQIWDGIIAKQENGFFIIEIDESAAMGRGSSFTVKFSVDEYESKMTVEATSRFKGVETIDIYELERR